MRQKRAEYLHWRKKNEVIRRLRATQPVGVGRDGMWASRGSPAPSPTPDQRLPKTTCAPLTTETQIYKTNAPDSNDTILFSIYYICWFLLFFHISIFYFLVDALRNSPVVLDPVRSATDHVIDAFQYFGGAYGCFFWFSQLCQ